MSRKTLFLEGLKAFIDQQNPLGAKEYIDNVVNFFDCPLSKAELDLALEKLFATKCSTVSFLKSSMQAKKLFQDSNVNILTLWHNLLTKHGSSANFSPYTQDIIQCCIRFIVASIAPSAKERERATMVLQVIFEKKLVDGQTASEVLDRVLNVFNIRKPPEMFAQQVFKLLGIIARFYPASVSEEHDRRIKVECFKTLDANLNIQHSQAEVHSKSLTGATDCLKDYLTNFAPSPDAEPESCDRMYGYIKKLSQLKDDIKQKSAFRAGLDLFTDHSMLFAKQIFADFKHWHKCLAKWLASKIYEDRRKGVFASYAFHKVIAQDLKVNESTCHETLNFILNEFRKTLESTESKLEETRIAIRGFGMMSLLCKRHLPAMLDDMISLVVQRCDLILMADDSAMRDLLDHFPDYIQALSTVVKEVQDPLISGVMVENLRNIMIRLVRDFHYLPTCHNYTVANAMCNAFHAIYLTDVTLLERLLSKVIFEGVVWTCSHKHTFDANADWAENVDWKDNITFKSYSILWHALLDEKAAFRSFDKSVIVNKIFDQLMVTLFRILDKLDLRTKKRVYTGEDGQDQEFHFCDPNFDLCPVRPKDFHIFINLVDFYRDLWSKFLRPHTLTWIKEFCERMVKFALRNPLVSGFLKLLEVGLSTAEYLKVFSKKLEPELEVTLAHALKIMIVKCQRVSGELQISTIELVLQYPVMFYTKCLIEIIPVFETALDLGKSMTWLANLAIECLEKISNHCVDSDYLKKLYAKVLPLLDSYLQGHCNVEFLSVRTGRGGNKIRKPGATRQPGLEFYDIQAKIVSLLGRLHPEAATALVVKSVKSENLVKWDSQKCVHLNLKLPDISPKIYIDTLVPRICHLALTSTDRQTKIAACEVVHALVLYLIGSRAHQGQTWTELCRRMLILGCDGDSTVQQIFEPLLMQVMHFMSKYENLDRGVEEVMDALMEGISSKSNFGLRDLSASCLREFVEWSIKQTTPQQLAASPVSMEIILGRLKMYSFDSDASKRVGAALAFNNLYRRLREEEAICDIFFIDLLYTFCVNFKLSEELTTLPPNDDSNSDLEMISEALDHVVRVLSERNYLYNRETDRRRVPAAMSSGNLQNVLKYLVFEAGSKKIFYRRKCMMLAQTLAPKVTSLTKLEDFFRAGSIDDDSLREICEGASYGCGIRARPDIGFLLHAHSDDIEKTFYNWLEYLLGALECYTWLLREKAISTGRRFFAKTNILHCISYYLENICWKTTSEVLVKLEITGYSSNEVSDNIDIVKCLIDIHIVDFLTEFLHSGCAQEEGVVFWETAANLSLRKLILHLIFAPDQLHLDFRLEKVFTQLNTRVNKFCKQVRDKCPHRQFFSDLNHEIIDQLINRMYELSQKLKEMVQTRGIVTTKSEYVKGILYILKTANLTEVDAANRRALMAASESILKTSFNGMEQTIFNKTVAVIPNEVVKFFASSLISVVFAVHDFSSEIIAFVLNDNELYVSSLDSKIKHGALYFETYGNVIYQEATLSFFEKAFELFQGLSDEQQSYLLRVLTGILDHKSKADTDTAPFTDLCVHNLTTLIDNFTHKTDDFYFVEYLTTLASMSIESSEAMSQQVPPLSQWIIGKLRSTTLNLEKKCKIISLLPTLIGVADYENHDLMSALENLQCRHFPLHSTEFAKNSLEETSLKFAFITILNALVASKSYVVLEFLFKCTASDEKHLVEDVIRKELKSFTLCLNDDQQVEILNRTFATVLNDAYEPTIRLTIFRRFLLNIFINSTEEALMEFFRQRIKQVSQLTEANYRVGISGRAVEQALANRIVGYGLIEQFFGIIRKELYLSTSCPIAIELLGTPKADSELVGTFTKKSFYVRTEMLTCDNKETMELFRQYQCAAYCALCSLVSNTQTELKFYSKFLFEENARKNELIWAKLIDCSSDKNYIFAGQEMEEYAKIKKRFVAIRQLNVRPTVALKTITSSKRLQTQNVMESSLSQDVRGVDMTSFSVRPHADAMRRQEIRSAEVLSVRLESHDLNKHEVMAMLCGVITFMHTNNITPVITDVSIKRSYPWVQALANSIGGCENHRNIRVFLAQVVDNCSEVFQQFAHVLFKPLLRMLVDECAGNSLNFFITDIIALLVTWSSRQFHTPRELDEIALIKDLLKFVMKNAASEKTEILKFNLEIVQTMLTAWKHVVSVPSNVLLDMITRTQQNDCKANESGIVFLGMVLSNDLIPWTDANKVLFISAILNNIENNDSLVYQPAAYSLGAALTALSNSGDQISVENLLIEINSRLNSLNSKKDRKSEKRFMDILYNIHKSSPQVVDDLREVICFKIPTALGASKRIYLEMILSRIESFEEEDIYNTLIGIGIRDLLKHSDYQLLGLHILNRALPMLKTHDISGLFELVEESLDLQQTDCRDIAYEVCIYVAQNYTSSLRDKAIKLLLKGISDPDVEIQKRIYQFWSKEANMSPKIIERLIYLLRKYASDGERHFLGLCTQLILDPAIESAESKKQIFEFEDDRDAKLHEYHISTKSRGRATYTLPPLFAESQQSRPSFFKATQLCSLVRDTNSDYVFEPTQDPKTITQARNSFTLHSQSSMPFQVATQVLDRRSQRIVAENRKDSSPQQLRRRFLKNTEKEKRDAVLRVINIRQKNAEKTAEKARANDVGLYRRYRFGEYPDLLINNLAFLLPLQALARRDLLVAKQLFVAIFTSILEAEEADSTEFLTQIDEIFQTVLRSASTCESTIFSAFLEVSLLKPSAFNLPADEVAKVAKTTKNLSIGALYLENRLNADWDEELAETLEPQHWLQLADIYNSLKEYEIVAAIFADKIRTDPRLAEAIDLRANGRADEAQTLLVEVIGRNVHIEHYYAYNCYYECSMELSNWSHATQAIQSEIDDMEELWTDSYNKNFLLPKLVHAKIQLLLEGDVESRDFLQTIREWMVMPNKAEHMKSEFCEELMMLWIANKDFRQCRVMYEVFLKKFLREWSVTSSLCTKTKLDSLLSAQRVAEIDNYAQQFLAGFDERSASELCRRWNLCVIDPTEPLRLWNTVVGYRKYIAALGVKTLEDAQIEEPQKRLHKSVYNMTLQLFNAAEQQKNFALALKVFERMIPNKADSSEVLTHELSKIKNIFLQTHRTTTSSSVDFIEAAWKATTKLLQSPIISQHHEAHNEALCLKSAIAMKAFDCIDQHLLDDAAEGSLKRTINSTSNDLKSDLFEHALEALLIRVSLVESSPTMSTASIADTHFRLAQFTYDVVSKSDAENYPKWDLECIFVKSVLQGMRHGSKEARQLFPCVLQLRSMENGALHDVFIANSAEIPVWSYLAWIPQILSSFQLSEECFLDEIVQKIATKYPDALRYPFAIWHKQAVSQLTLGTRLENYSERRAVRDVLDSLRSKLCDKFAKSFRYLAVPEAYLLAQLESFDRDIRSNPSMSENQFKNLTENLISDVFCEEDGLQGVTYRRLLKYKEPLEGLKALSFTLHTDRIRKTLSDLERALRKHLSSGETNLRLEALCPWLAHYQWCGEEDSIELPGQYAKNALETIPRVRDHIKIVRFDSKVRVLISQRYPIRIAIHGSNGRIYDFLVKHGEDLKQDQRIQQILQLMSQKLHEDKNCQSHNLYIRTYQIVPIDRNCGVLSWVRDTVSLHEFILNCFHRHCPTSHEILDQTIGQYLGFIGRASQSLPKTGNFMVYGTAASKYTRDQLIQNFRALENRIDYDITKKALLDLAISPGSFFALRNNFATSLAAMNIAHWILGVGDRHLQNTLISVKDGSVTGIDFGFTFGSGTRDQKVPELTPFRLTPHLVNAMTPMGTSGLIFKCMVHALRVFRCADRILLACMEVFIREPSVNWLDSARQSNNEGEELIMRDWEPRDRIDIARCKLQGSNPMHLFERELNVGLISGSSEYLSGYIRILRGHIQFNIRSRLPPEKLTVEEQVKCLIDQATDPAVLGIAYAGFAPWV